MATSSHSLRRRPASSEASLRSSRALWPSPCCSPLRETPPRKCCVKTVRPASQVHSLCVKRGTLKSHQGAVLHRPLRQHALQKKFHALLPPPLWDRGELPPPPTRPCLAVDTNWPPWRTLGIIVTRPWRAKWRSWPTAVPLALPLLLSFCLSNGSHPAPGHSHWQVPAPITDRVSTDRISQLTADDNDDDEMDTTPPCCASTVLSSPDSGFLSVYQTQSSMER